VINDSMTTLTWLLSFLFFFNPNPPHKNKDWLLRVVRAKRVEVHVDANYF